MGGSGGSGHLTRVAVAVVLFLGATACADSGRDGGSSAGEDAAPKAGCDRDVNTTRFNETTAVDHAHMAGMDMSHGRHGPVTFTIAQWVGAFTDPALGMSTAAVQRAVEGNVVYRRHILTGVLTEALGPEPWSPLTDPAACRALGADLRRVRQVVSRFPTVADAVAAGYTQGDRYVAGMGVHFQNWNLLGGFDLDKPVQLLYDGDHPDSHLVGVSYVVKSPGGRPPAGFPGDNDRWHHHGKYCLDLAHGGINLGTDVLSKAECTAMGGTEALDLDGWMLHVWAVPGCENDWGIFSSVNPRLPYLPPGVRLGAGCRAAHL
jgi:hypothetical protein